ncbi:hypothetical protein CLI85_12465 [Tannerella forsythia]|nr:hypothetical protein CLI85_12465 [Tannerella forsythia]
MIIFNLPNRKANAFLQKNIPPKMHFFSSLQFAPFPVYPGKNLGGVDIAGCSARILHTLQDDF